MDCALWLNRKKIYAASEISDNLDIASLRGYLLAGSLVPWLEEHGGKHYAEHLAELSHDDPLLNDKIARIFGGNMSNSAPYKTLDGGSDETSPIIAAITSFNIGSAGSYNYNALSSFGSFYNFLQSFTSAESGSFKFQEYFTSFTSFTGSYGIKSVEWEWLWNFLSGGSSFTVTSGGSFSYGWEWLWNFLFGGSSFTATSGGSFSYGWEWLWNFLFGGSSFTVTSGGSFSYGWEWLWNFLFGGSSFTATSGGSFSYGWEWLWNLLLGSSSFTVTSGGSFSYGWEWLRQLLFGGRGSFGSFDWRTFGFGSFGLFDLGLFDKLQNAEPEKLLPHLDEYDLVLLKTLINCPLDRFGYGIHNI